MQLSEAMVHSLIAQQIWRVETGASAEVQNVFFSPRALFLRISSQMTFYFHLTFHEQQISLDVPFSQWI